MSKKCEDWCWGHMFLDPTGFSPATLDPSLPKYQENITTMAEEVRKMFHQVTALEDWSLIFLPYNKGYEFQSLRPIN